VRKDGASPDDIKGRVRKLVGTGAGLYRNGAGLAAASEGLRALRSEIESGLRVRGIKDAVKAHEASNMVLTALMITEGGLARTESRGAHQRTDYRTTDDAKWIRHVTFNKSADGSLAMIMTPIR
jgi:fumarate reductase flavoprotein subunit